MFFNQIINKKIDLGKKNVKIKFDLMESLSNTDIINLVTKRENDAKIKEYIDDKIKMNNNIIKNLEILLNNDIFITEIYFNLKKYDYCRINYKKDLIEYKDNETNDEKNILINFKLKRAELINKILEKNCKNIIKMDYLVFYKMPYNDDKYILPLIELDKFENLDYLGLKILHDGNSEEELIYNFPNKLNKLKSLKISGSFELNVNIKKEILDELDVLKIKDVYWIIEEDETFHFKNIKELHIKDCGLPFKYIEHKKYFFKELLKGNISWEKLSKLKITSIFTDLESNIEDNIEDYLNKEIIDFFSIAALREGYESPNCEFFEDFFNFIFKNQNMYIKTNKNCKNIEEFIIKIYDSNPFDCPTCERENIIYEKKGKNVNIEVCKGLYEYSGFYESPSPYIDLDSVIIDQSLDSFTIDNYTINDLKYL